jgi:hypothetical protein
MPNQGTHAAVIYTTIETPPHGVVELPGSVEFVGFCWVGMAVGRLALPSCGSPGSSGRGLTSWSDRRGDGGDSGEGADEIVGPGPGGRDEETSASGAVGQSGWDVQQAVAQCCGYSCGQWPGQRE